MRLVIYPLTAACSLLPRRVQLALCYPAVSGCAFGTEAQHHRHHQAAVATSSEAGRQQLSDYLSVDRRPAVLQHVLLLR